MLLHRIAVLQWRWTASAAAAEGWAKVQSLFSSSPQQQQPKTIAEEISTQFQMSYTTVWTSGECIVYWMCMCLVRMLDDVWMIGCKVVFLLTIIVVVAVVAHHCFCCHLGPGPAMLLSSSFFRGISAARSLNGIPLDRCCCCVGKGKHTRAKKW